MTGVIQRGLVVLALIGLSVGCSSPEAKSILEKDHRIPDVEGVVMEVGPSGLTLDGGRNFEISPNVESFTTQSHDSTPLSTWKNRFVQLGVADKQVIWIAGVGIVAGEPEQVLYTGKFQKAQGGRAYFADGTTLKLGSAKPPSKPGPVAVVIDPNSRRIKSITAQAG